MIDTSKYDILIVGSGIAAQSVIQKLSPTKKILVLEGGLANENPRSELLTINNDYGHIANGWWQRHWVRAYGGTSRRWSGWVATMDARDFEGHHGLPKWPISKNDLQIYYPQAVNFLNRHSSILDFGENTNTSNDFVFKPFSNGSPRRFLDINEISSHKNVDIILGVNVIRLESEHRGTISGIWANEKGTINLYQIHSKQLLILACGGLGNAQILLQPNPRSHVPIGNESNFVGKFLMEHPHAMASDILINKQKIEEVGNKFGLHTRAFVPSDNLYKSNSLFGYSIALEDIPKGLRIEDKEQSFFEKKFKAKLELINGYARAEQQPRIDNYAQIINEKNWAGLYRLRTQCAFSGDDLYNIDKCTRLFGEYLYKNQIGILKINNNKIYRDTGGGGHTMGTTKMGFSSKDSVCDKNLKVHGYNNLYLAGSSVFTTSGASNPTLTITALSLRLGEFLAKLKL